MTATFEAAAAAAKARREALMKTLSMLRERVRPPQLAEDALRLLDPELSFLARMKLRVQQNRLLSLAVLAGAGWLVGAPRQRNGGPLEAREAGSTPPRATMKENNNDSGQDHGYGWRDPGPGKREERGPQAQQPQAFTSPRQQRRGQARPGGNLAPLDGKPEERGNARRRPDRPKQRRGEPLAEQPQTGAER